MEVYVVRHTAVAVDKGICYGQTDVALSPDYVSHIHDVQTRIAEDFDQVYSSPLNRCRLLAEQLSTNSVICDDALMEMNFGIWENTPWESMDPLLSKAWMEDFVYTKTPEGESLELLYIRVSAFVEQLRNQPHKKVAIVTHAGVVRCIWAYLLDIPLQNIFKIPINYGEGMVFKLGETKELDQIVKMVF